MKKTKKKGLASLAFRIEVRTQADDLLRANGSSELCYDHYERTFTQIFNPSVGFGRRLRGAPSGTLREPRQYAPLIAKSADASKACKFCGGPCSKTSLSFVCRNCYRNKAADKFKERLVARHEAIDAFNEKYQSIDLALIYDHMFEPDFAPELIEQISELEIERGEPIVFWSARG